MYEQTFELENIDPVSFFGVNNSKIELVRSYFPKLKIIARGHQLIVKGEKKETQKFEDKLDLLLAYFEKYNSLPDETIRNIAAENMEQFNEEMQKPQPSDILFFGNSGKPIKARTKNQHRLVEKVMKNDLVFAIGPAGTGKTYTAIAMAVRMLKQKEIRRIFLCRPAVEAGERLGFLPGDVKEKIDPYLQPLYDALGDMIPERKLEEFMKDGIIQIAPLAFMRGRTLSNAFVILDEAQNTTENQLKMFLTRMGENAKFVITGDITQIDLPSRQQSGMIQGLKILQHIKGISFVKFDRGDIVRHPLVKDIVDAYEKFHQSAERIIENEEQEEENK